MSNFTCVSKQESQPFNTVPAHAFTMFPQLWKVMDAIIGLIFIFHHIVMPRSVAVGYQHFFKTLLSQSSG
jgi:hypothetical protein